MPYNPPKSHFYTEDDLPLLQLSHTYAQSSVWLENGMSKQIATFDLYVRDMPANRNFMLAAGLEEVLTWLQKLRFTEDQIQFLLEANLISEQFAEYLRGFKFTGTVWAMPEGTVVFPYEPIMRVTGSLIEAAIIEIFIMSAVASNLPFLSKAARIKIAGQERFTLITAPFRAHSFESGAKACRAAYMCGIVSGGNPAIPKKYHMPIPPFLINAQHYFISSFPSELEAFRALAKFRPEACSFMIDTYSVKQGVANAITVAKELLEQGHHLRAIAIDSGDLVEHVRYMRQQLDAAELPFVKVLVSGHTTEHKIAELVAADAPADMVALVTEYVTLMDSPKLELVYKLAEMRDGDNINYAGKFSEGKISYPGRKQVFRQYENGKMVKDVIGLDSENFGTPLLQEVMREGKLVYDLPGLDEIREYVTQQLSTLPDNLLDLYYQYSYLCESSGEMERILDDLRKHHRVD